MSIHSASDFGYRNEELENAADMLRNLPRPRASKGSPGMPASYLEAAGRLHANILALNNRFPAYVGNTNRSRIEAAKDVAAAIIEANRLTSEFVADMARTFGDDGASLDTKAFEDASTDAGKDLAGALTMFAERLESEREAA